VWRQWQMHHCLWAWFVTASQNDISFRRQLALWDSQKQPAQFIFSALEKLCHISSASECCSFSAKINIWNESKSFLITKKFLLDEKFLVKFEKVKEKQNNYLFLQIKMKKKWISLKGINFFARKGINWKIHFLESGQWDHLIKLFLVVNKLDRFLPWKSIFA